MVETLFSQFHNPANGRRLFAVTEPLAPTADGMRVAAEVIETLGETFRDAQGPLSTALRAACDAAHNRVRAANQPAPNRSLDERVLVGLTAVAVERDAMLIAQAPPGQAIVVQDRQLYAIPSLDSWRGNYDAGEEDETPRPLGVGDRPALRLSATNAAPADQVMLCSSALGACLGRGLADEDAEPADLVPALTGDAAELSADLDEIAYVLGEGRSLAACFHHLESGEHWIWTSDRAFAGQTAPPLRISTDVVANDNGPRPLVRNAAHGGQSSVHSPEGMVSAPMAEGTVEPCACAPCENEPPPDRLRWFGRAPETMERIQNACVTVCERIAGGIGARLRRGDRRGSSFPAPGARSMHVYRSSVTGPIAPSIRAHLPRGPMVHIPVRLLAVLATAVMIFAIAGFLYDRDRERDARAQAYLDSADTQLQTVAAASEPSSVASALSAAQTAVDRARENGAGDQVLATRQAAIDAARDAVRGIDRLENVHRVGTLPTLDDDVPRRLILIERDVYLLADALYHVDGQSRSLTRLLEPGMRIERATVHDLRDVTVDDGVVTVTDGLALYRLREDGSWDRQKIGRVDGKTPWDLTACAAFEGSFYLLDADNGQILKFPADQLSSLPDDWAGPEERSDLAGALDMVIDGRIYVLLEDGTIQTYYRGSADGAVTVEVDPGLTDPVALFGGAGNAYLYVADRPDGGGRIARLDRTGGGVRQYRLPREAPAAAAAAFVEIDDFIVDEAAGIVYVLSGNQLWSATLPSPETVAQSG